ALVEAMLMMRPGRFCSTIHRLAARVRRKVPRRLTATTRSHTRGSRAHTRPIAPAPAELRRMSSRPNRASVSATARSQSPSSLTSPATVASASRPSAPAVSSSRSALWSKRPTRAPAAIQAAAAARPIPDAPPLTSATLPAKLQVMSDMACVYSSRARACLQPRVAGARLVRPRAAAGGHGADASRAHRRCARAAGGGVRAVRLLGAAVVALVASGAWAAPLQRFFVMGDGTLAVVNAHTGERAEVRYRRAGGAYGQAAIARIRGAFRSSGDDGEGRASLRLIEVLSWVQKTSRVRALTLMSGYRS